MFIKSYGIPNCRNNIVFNLIAFNSELHDWQFIGPVIPDEANCHDAVAWVDQLTANGGTATEDAIFRAFHHLNAVDPEKGVCPGKRKPAWMNVDGNMKEFTKAIYLITDGKPDSSCSSIIKAVKETWRPDIYETNQSSKSTESKTKVRRKSKQVLQLLRGPPIHCISYTEET